MASLFDLTPKEPTAFLACAATGEVLRKATKTEVALFAICERTGHAERGFRAEGRFCVCKFVVDTETTE